jgi:hypothetical protein
MSVPLDVGTHSKLSAMASLRGMDRGALAASMIAEGVRGIVVIDRQAKSADAADSAHDGVSAA